MIITTHEGGETQKYYEIVPSNIYYSYQTKQILLVTELQDIAAAYEDDEVIMFSDEKGFTIDQVYKPSPTFAKLMEINNFTEDRFVDKAKKVDAGKYIDTVVERVIANTGLTISEMTARTKQDPSFREELLKEIDKARKQLGTQSEN